MRLRRDWLMSPRKDSMRGRKVPRRRERARGILFTSERSKIVEKTPKALSTANGLRNSSSCP